MNFLSTAFSFKRIVVLISFFTVSLILWNTYMFFQKFKNEERIKMEILAMAQKNLANADINSDIALPDKIITTNTNIPLILVNEKGEIQSYQNLNDKKAANPNYLQNQLAKMKVENKPIEINYTKNNKHYIYYRDSDLLNKLTYYPLALILILILFITVIYMFFNSTKIAEQNKLWTGMAKETAHQIGTPLSSLMGWISILRTENIDQSYVVEIEKDVNRLHTIASRFSKIGSVPELKKENIIAVTQQTFDYLESRSSKQISFTFFKDVNEAFVNLNTELYGWVIENLIKNAIDAMQGKGDLQLSIETTHKKVKITVADSGKGMAKKIFKQVFKPGFTTKKRGWGLGLSLSKRIVEDYHKGKISVQKSEINKGTTFEVLLDVI